MDIFEKDDKYFLKAEAPGLNKDDFKITLQDGVLTVTGKKEHNREEQGTNYYLRETGFGEFSRSFRLPGEIEEDKIEATYRDGILTLEMPRKMPERKQVTIN